MRGFELISKKQFKKDFKDLNVNLKDLKLPERSTKLSAGYDFYIPIDIKLKPGQSIKVPTGIKSFMNNDEVLQLYPRSGYSFKYFLKLANTVGIIDSDYYDNPDNEGHIWIKLRNEGDEMININKNDKIVQGIFSKFLTVEDENMDKETRAGGLGSTNKTKN